MTPTHRTKTYLERQGDVAGVVERYIPQARRRVDLFGCIDLVAIVGTRIVGIQATTYSNVPARIAKALRSPALRRWLAAGAGFEVWGWRQGRERGGGGRAGYRARRVEIVASRPSDGTLRQRSLPWPPEKPL